MVKLPVILVFALWATSGSAGVILSPIAIEANFCCIEGTIATPAIDQSGLSTPFVSGSTDFAGYIASNPTHCCGFFTDSLFGAPFFGDGLVDLDLGRVYVVQQLALWNAGKEENDSISTFTVFTAIDSDFTNAAMVGTFTNPEYPIENPEPATVFHLADSEGAFVRLLIDFDSSRSFFLDIGEIAFEVVPLAVSEPTTLALLVSALAGLGFARRRKPR